MDINILRKAFAEQYNKVDQYFDRVLCNNPYTRPSVELHKKILMANLFSELVRIHQMKTYLTYEAGKLISIKREKVWIAYVRSLEREADRKKKITTDRPPDNYETESFQNELESKNALLLIREFLNPSDYDLLLYRAKGYSYEQIWEIANYKSPDAAKTRYHRTIKLVRKHFRIQIFKK